MKLRTEPGRRDMVRSGNSNPHFPVTLYASGSLGQAQNEGITARSKKILYLAAALVLSVAITGIAWGAENKGFFPVFGLPEREPSILQSLAGPIHLGDEELPDWPQLYGNCLELDFQIVPSIRRLTLILQTYGLEINAPVYLNYRKFAVLPRRTGIPSSTGGPEKWSQDLIFEVPVAKLCNGLNRITITTDLVARPKFSGDLADFQIRNLRLISK